MSTAVLAPTRRRPPGRRRCARPTGRRPLGVAPLPPGMASAVPDPRPHHRRGGGDDRRLRRRDEHAAAEELRLRHGAGLRVLHDATTRTRRASSRRLEHRFGRVEVIENETQSIPGSINTYQLRAQDPHGPFSGPMLSLVSGRYPVGRRRGRRDERRRLGVPLEGRRHLASRRRRAPGGRHRREPPEPPRRVRARRAGAGDEPDAESRRCSTRRAFRSSSIGHRRADPGLGRTVEPAQPRDDLARRTGPRDAAHRPRLDRRLHRARAAPAPLDRDARVDRRHRPPRPSRGQRQRHRRRRRRCHPRLRPRARRLARLPPESRAERAPRHRRARPPVDRGRRRDGAWRSSRPTSRRPVRRGRSPRCRSSRRCRADRRLLARSTAPRSPASSSSSLAFLLLGYSGGTNRGNGSGGAPELLFGIVLLIPGLILLAPFFLSLTARLGRRAPIATRLALRDLARYRARSGSALAAISLGVLVAVIVMLAAVVPLWERPRLRGPEPGSNQLALHANTPPPPGTIVTGPNGTHVPSRSSHDGGGQPDGAGDARRSDRAGLSAHSSSPSRRRMRD